MTDPLPHDPPDQPTLPAAIRHPAEPLLLLDKELCLRNIREAVGKARRLGVSFRPHFKTHQSHTIGRWFRAEGVDRITVSSNRMAEYFAQDGWADITVALPVNTNDMARMDRLAGSIALNLLVLDAGTVDRLGDGLGSPAALFIEVDCGQHRTGVSPTDHAAIEAILDRIARHGNLRFAGFLTHAGQSYAAAGDRQRILDAHRESTALLLALKERYAKDFPGLLLSAGDTPTFNTAEDFTGIGEVRPGNLVFHDLAQTAIGSCGPERIAVAMRCPVLAVYPERGELVVHGGAVHFSKDHLRLPDGSPCYGVLVRDRGAGWDTLETGLVLTALSQEHGTLSGPPAEIANYRPGDGVTILPVHSCLTADAMGAYTTLEGERIERL